MKSVAASEALGFGGGQHAFGAGGMKQRSSGGADAEFEGGGERLLFVQTEQAPGGKGVTRAGGSDDERGGHAHGGLPDDGAIDGGCARAFREMKDDVAADAQDAQPILAAPAPRARASAKATLVED